MGDIVPLPTKGKWTVRPEQFHDRMYLCCSCSVSEENGWIPVTLRDELGWFIVALICVECQREVPIRNGREMR